MSKNTVLKILTGAILLVVLLILLNTHSTNTSVIEVPRNPIHEEIASQFNDNLREVAARLEETEQKLQALRQEKPVVVREPVGSEALQQHDINQALQQEIAYLKEKLEHLEEEKPEEAYPVKAEAPSEAPVNTTSIVPTWNPLQVAEVQTHAPYYTIPAGSDFGHVTLLSSLIGEVPSEGKLMQPLFPFSAVIHRDELMAANGVPLSEELAGMKISGYAIGVGSFLDNISCVRAYVTSALFVFEDGHFVTVGDEAMQHSTELLDNESLGYLTTPYGNPCIQGKYITNAPHVIRAFMASSAIEGAGHALTDWKMPFLSEEPDTLKNQMASLAHVSAGGALNQSAFKVSDWIEKRLQGSFDVVYVPASIPSSHGFQPNTVSLHITKTMFIDKEKNGRLLHYAHQASHTLDSSFE